MHQQRFFTCYIPPFSSVYSIKIRQNHFVSKCFLRAKNSVFFKCKEVAIIRIKSGIELIAMDIYNYTLSNYN